MECLFLSTDIIYIYNNNNVNLRITQFSPQHNSVIIRLRNSKNIKRGPAHYVTSMVPNNT